MNHAPQPVFPADDAPAPVEKAVPKDTPATDDIAQLRAVARLLLRQLEIAIKRRKVPVTRKNALTSQPGKQELLFGKRGYVDTLVMLTDLLLKLDQSGPPAEKGYAAESPPEVAMDEADVALVGAFVERMRQRKPDSD